MRHFIVSALAVSSVLSVMILLECRKDTLDDAYEESSEPADADFVMITPFVSMSDMGPIWEAYSEDASAPWGFIHRGIDFFPLRNLAPFQAASSGIVQGVDLWQLETTGNWQVNLLLRYNATFSLSYAFEPMTGNPADGQMQADHIWVTEGQEVSQGDTLGFLFAPVNGSHVDFGLLMNDPDDGVLGVCPEPYFTQAARDSILTLIQRAWSGAEMCYFAE